MQEYSFFLNLSHPPNVDPAARESSHGLYGGEFNHLKHVNGDDGTMG